MYNYEEFKPSADTNILAKITEAVREVKKTEVLVEEKEEELTAAKKQLKYLLEDVLPSLMEEAQQDKLKTSDGTPVEVFEKIHANIPKEYAPQALKWLEDNNYGKLIKRKFMIEFNKEDEEWAKEFAEELRGRNRPLNYSQENSVHHQTLTAFVKARLKEGDEDLPLDLLGVHQARIAKVK